MTRTFYYFDEAANYAEEIYGAVYWDSKPSSLKHGIYIVPETNEENNEAQELGLELATGFEGQRTRPDWEQQN